jgi:hypothetical protein
MLAVSDPNMVVAELGLAVLAVAVFFRFLLWIRDAPVTPDPWDAAVEQKLSEPETSEVCPHCSTPQPPDAWFCEGCGRAVGPYNNVMPFLQVFSEGEVLRNGTTDRMRKGLLIPIGYFLMSLGFLAMALARPYGSWLLSCVILFGVFSYWSSVLKNLKRSNAGPAEAQPENTP